MFPAISFSQDTTLIVNISKIDTTKMFYNYYQFDSVFDSDLNVVTIKIAYSEKEQTYKIKENQSYSLTGFPINPSKYISEGDTIYKISCRSLFGDVWITNSESSGNAVSTKVSYLNIRKIKKHRNK
jgi:hypothetical protein